MPTPRPPIEPLFESLGEFLSAVSAIWDTYRKAGPGKVEASLFEPAEVAYGEIDRLLNGSANDVATDATLREAVAELYDLSQRCACRSEGLCFITGEAGLIPRRDKEAAFDERLAWLRAILADRVS